MMPTPGHALQGHLTLSTTLTLLYKVSYFLNLIITGELVDLLDGLRFSYLFSPTFRPELFPLFSASNFNCQSQYWLFSSVPPAFWLYERFFFPLSPYHPCISWKTLLVVFLLCFVLFPHCLQALTSFPIFCLVSSVPVEPWWHDLG